MRIKELIEQLEQEKSYATERADFYRKKVAEGDSPRQMTIWLSYIVEYETRSDTLYGVLYQLKKLEE